jgi:hypothetical protein
MSTPKQEAQKLILAVGIHKAREIASSALDVKRKEKPTSIGIMLWVEEIDFLKEVLKIINDHEQTA